MKNVKYLVMDVDGTLTDGKIYMGNNGEVCKAFNVKDGYGIHDIAIPNSIVPVIITGRTSTIVANRCKELGITEVHQGVSDKTEVLARIVKDFGSVAYIGDDLNDLDCMIKVKDAGGVLGCPANAVKQIQEVVHFIAESNGGDGAVREYIEWLVS